MKFTNLLTDVANANGLEYDGSIFHLKFDNIQGKFSLLAERIGKYGTQWLVLDPIIGKEE